MLMVYLSSCTANQRARNFGGTMTHELPKGQELVTVTWKDEQLWILTKPMPTDYQPTSYTFQEKSSFGVMEGTVVLKEIK